MVASLNPMTRAHEEGWRGLGWEHSFSRPFQYRVAEDARVQLRKHANRFRGEVGSRNNLLVTKTIDRAALAKSHYRIDWPLFVRPRIDQRDAPAINNNFPRHRFVCRLENPKVTDQRQMIVGMLIGQG